MEIINRSSYLGLWKNLIANKQITTPHACDIEALPVEPERNNQYTQYGHFVDPSLQLKFSRL
jgi:hypothetical protein